MVLPKISETELTENNICILKANTYEENNQTLIFKFIKKTKEEETPIVFERNRSQNSLNMFDKCEKITL